MGTTPRVIVESPYTSKTAHGLIVHRNYLIACLLDSTLRGEAPFAGHGFYTQFLNDRVPNARQTGMRCARQWMYVCDYVAVYMNFGMTKGMYEGVKLAKDFGKPVFERTLEPGSWDEDAPKHRHQY